MSDNISRTITPNPPADFTPSMGNYQPLQPFRYWCQKVLPLVYDDSLSYYELLCKVVDYLNKTMEDVETLHGDVSNLHKAYVQLQQYVNNYFSSLDVQEEINKKLDEMVTSGELYQYIQKFLGLFTTPIVYGAVGDGVTDDTDAFIKMLDDGAKYIDLVGKKYLLSKKITLDIRHIKNGEILTNITTSTLNDAFLTFTGDNITIENIRVNCGHYADRPFYKQPGYDEYIALRGVTLLAIKLLNCTNVYVSNVFCTECVNALFVTGSSFIKVNSCTAYKTLGDGFYVTGNSHDVVISNCIANLVMDDNFSVNGFSQNSNELPSRITYTNCTSYNCFGALVALLSCNDCTASNLIGYGNKYSPIKLGTLEVSKNYACKSRNTSISNVTCYLNGQVDLVDNALLLIDGTADKTSEHININNLTINFYGNPVKAVLRYVNRLNISGLILNGVETSIENSSNVNLCNSNIFVNSLTLTSINFGTFVNSIVSTLSGGINLGSCNDIAISGLKHITHIYVNNCANIKADVKVDGVNSSGIISTPNSVSKIYDMMANGTFVLNEDGRIGYIYNNKAYWLNNVPT